MFCINCGEKIVEGAKFYFNRGTSVSAMLGGNQENACVQSVNIYADVTKELKERELKVFSDYLDKKKEEGEKTTKEDDDMIIPVVWGGDSSGK